MVTALHRKIRYRSGQSNRQIGVIPMIMMISMAWALAGVGMVQAGLIASHSVAWASIILIAMCSMGFYFVLQIFHWIKESDDHYEICFDGDLVSLAAFDDRERAKNIQQVRLSEVNTAEYYEPKDSRNLLLHSKNSDLQIPLWSFKSDVAKNIVEYVRARGVQVIGVTNDILI